MGNAWKDFKGKETPATNQLSPNLENYLRKGKILLDLGCGYGRFSSYFKDCGCTVYGIDINANCIEQAKENSDNEGIIFEVQDAAKTNYRDNLFDVIVSQAVLGTMELSLRQDVLKEVFRILKPEGIFHLGEFGRKENYEEKYAEMAKITGEYGTHIKYFPDGTERFRTHHFEKQELEDLISVSGLKIIRTEELMFRTISGKIQQGYIVFSTKQEER